MLELRNLSVAVGGKVVVDDVSLTVRPGQVTALLGANGAGKSELVLAVARLLPVLAGSVTVDGHPINGAKPNRIRAAGRLSGGQQQMVAIGHALMARPRYILIDEMSLGLAPLIVKCPSLVVAALAAKGMGLSLVEQFVEVALSLASDVIVLRKGSARLASDPATLRAHPATLTAAYPATFVTGMPSAV